MRSSISGPRERGEAPAARGRRRPAARRLALGLVVGERGEELRRRRGRARLAARLEERHERAQRRQLEAPALDVVAQQAHGVVEQRAAPRVIARSLEEARELAHGEEIARRLVGRRAKARARGTQLARALVELTAADERRETPRRLALERRERLGDGERLLDLARLEVEVGQRRERLVVVGLGLQHARVGADGPLRIRDVARVDAAEAQEDLAQRLGRALDDGAPQVQLAGLDEAAVVVLEVGQARERARVLRLLAEDRLELGLGAGPISKRPREQLDAPEAQRRDLERVARDADARRERLGEHAVRRVLLEQRAQRGEGRLVRGIDVERLAEEAERSPVTIGRRGRPRLVVARELGGAQQRGDARLAATQHARLEGARLDGGGEIAPPRGLAAQREERRQVLGIAREAGAEAPPRLTLLPRARVLARGAAPERRRRAPVAARGRDAHRRALEGRGGGAGVLGHLAAPNDRRQPRGLARARQQLGGAARVVALGDEGREIERVVATRVLVRRILLERPDDLGRARLRARAAQSREGLRRRRGLAIGGRRERLERQPCARRARAEPRRGPTRVRGERSRVEAPEHGGRARRLSARLERLGDAQRLRVIADLGGQRRDELRRRRAARGACKLDRELDGERRPRLRGDEAPSRGHGPPRPRPRGRRGARPRRGARARRSRPPPRRAPPRRARAPPRDPRAGARGPRDAPAPCRARRRDTRGARRRRRAGAPPRAAPTTTRASGRPTGRRPDP